MDGKNYTLKWGPHDGAMIVVFGNAPASVFAPARSGFDFVPFTSQAEAQNPFRYELDRDNPDRYVYLEAIYTLKG